MTGLELVRKLITHDDCTQKEVWMRIVKLSPEGTLIEAHEAPVTGIRLVSDSTITLCIVESQLRKVVNP